MCTDCKRRWCAGSSHPLPVSVADKTACANCGDAVCVQCRYRGNGAPDVTSYVTYYHGDCCFPCEEPGCGKCYVDLFPDGSERPIVHKCTLCGRNVCADHATLDKNDAQTDRYGRLVRGPVCSRHCVMCGETKPTQMLPCTAPNYYESGDTDTSRKIDLALHGEVAPTCDKLRTMCAQCWGMEDAEGNGTNVHPKCPDVCEFMQLLHPRSDRAQRMREEDERDARMVLSPETQRDMEQQIFRARSEMLSPSGMNLTTITQKIHMLKALKRRKERKGESMTVGEEQRLHELIDDSRDLTARINGEEERLKSIMLAPVDLLVECSICREPMTGDRNRLGVRAAEEGDRRGSRVTLNCGHIFHYICLKQHYEGRREWEQDIHCPICRSTDDTRPASTRFPSNMQVTPVVLGCRFTSNSSRVRSPGLTLGGTSNGRRLEEGEEGEGGAGVHADLLQLL